MLNLKIRKMKRLCKFFVFVMMLLNVVNVSATDVWDGTSTVWTKGDGSESNPYQLETTSQLAYLATKVNSGTSYEGIYFKQMQDFDMGGKKWTAIGKSTSYIFKGNYDGGSFKIYNIVVSSSPYALFGNVKDATIKGVNLENLALTTNTTGTVKIENCIVHGIVKSNAGGYVGANSGVLSLENCSVNDSIFATTSMTGGFVGNNSGTITFLECIGNAAVISSFSYSSGATNESNPSVSQYCYAGGFVGYSTGKTTFKRCIMSGNVTLSGSASYTNWYYPIYEAYRHAPSVSIYSYAGGFIGKAADFVLDECYSNTNISVKSYASSNYTDGYCSDCGYTYSYAGGICGNSASSKSSITNSYSSGNLSYVGKKYTTSGFVATGSATIKNCYYNGTNALYGAQSTGTTTNVFSLEGSSTNTGGTKTKTKAQMESSTFVDTLNADSIVFLYDSAPQVNNGFPIIKGLPIIKTLEASKVKSKKATINGVCKEATNVKNVGFEYAHTDSTTTSEKVLSLSESFSVSLDNLKEGNTYKYRAFYEKSGGIKVYGNWVTFTTSTGCEETVVDTSATICQGEEYVFGNKILTESGVFQDTLLSSEECDSIINLSLTVLPTTELSIYKKIREDSIYIFYGDSIATAGTYTKLVPSDTGCVNVTLTLTTLPVVKINILSNDTTMGTVEGGGVYIQDSSLTISATPAEGYYFMRWSDDNTDNPRTIVALKETSLTAIFAAPVNLEISTIDACGGNVYGGGSFKAGETTKIAATAKDGYEFVKWSDGVTDKVRTINVTQDTALTAVFELKTYSVTVNSDDDEMGLALGSGTYKHGETVKITAVPFDDYTFTNWSDNDTTLERSIIVISDVELTANFKAESTTNVTLCNNDNVKVYTESLTIVVDGITTENVSVYNTLSQLIYTGNEERISVPTTGIYLVKIDDEVVKVIVSK